MNFQAHITLMGDKIVLSKLEKHILQKAKLNNTITIEDSFDYGKPLSQANVKDAFSHLVANGFLIMSNENTINANGDIRRGSVEIYRLSPVGIAFHESAKNRWIQAWWPLIISTIALISSFRTEILWLLRSAQQWLSK